MERGLPLFASTIATPVLRREASTASTRITVNLKSPGPGSTWNRQVPPQPLYSRQNVERSAYTNGEQRVNQLPYDHRDHDRCSFHRAFVIRYDERLESNRNAGFARRRRSLSKSANSRQADCEPVSIASRAGPDEMGGGSRVSRISTGRVDLWNRDRITEERALSSFRWVHQLVASPECGSSALYRSRLLHRAS